MHSKEFNIGRFFKVIGVILIIVGLIMLLLSLFGKLVTLGVILFFLLICFVELICSDGWE